LSTASFTSPNSSVTTDFCPPKKALYDFFLQYSTLHSGPRLGLCLQKRSILFVHRLADSSELVILVSAVHLTFGWT
jgi:hypothetical protein